MINLNKFTKQDKSDKYRVFTYDSYGYKPTIQMHYVTDTTIFNSGRDFCATYEEALVAANKQIYAELKKEVKNCEQEIKSAESDLKKAKQRLAKWEKENNE